MIDRAAAFKAVRADVLSFCASLGPADWRMNSRAEGWSVADVVAHMAAGCHVMFTPSVATLMRADDLERVNDQMVEGRRDRTPAQVFSEYRRWSGVFGMAAPMLVSRLLGDRKLPVAELGRFPMRLMVSALAFDHHTHLSYDVAPALGRGVPAADANRMAAVLEWMTAVLGNQLSLARPPWLDRPVSITLSGPGGGTWTVGPSGAVTTGGSNSVASQIHGLAGEFPEWGTRRADWRDRQVTVNGDTEYGARLLDAMNIV